MVGGGLPVRAPLGARTRVPGAHGLRRRVSPDDPVEKRELIEGYRTQVDALFPGDQVPPRAEEYYTRA